MQDLGKIQEPKLQDLAASIPNTLRLSRAESTVQKYTRSVEWWKKWAGQYPEIPQFPAQPAHIALYLQHLLDTTEAKTAVDDAVNALAWAHDLGGLQSPTSHPTVKTMRESAHRMKGRPTVKKEPVAPQLLRRMVNLMAQQSASLLDIRTVSVCLLAFSGFFRFNELAQIRCSDLQFSSTDVRVRVQHSKTDQYRDGNEVLIARTGSSTCPVAMLERYMAMANLTTAVDNWLFRPLTATKYGHRLKKVGKMTYSRVREVVREALRRLGEEPDAYGLHSLRAGGASAAANAGVEDRLFKRHGRWRSENAKDGYVKDSYESRLSVSLNLGL